MTRLVVHIDRLVLEGIEPGERGRFTRALRTELARRLERPGTMTGVREAGDRSEIDAGRTQSQRAGDAAGLGRAAAARIARGIRR